jgi:NADH-ubiquinone oxidoreductase chain 4
MYLSLLILLPLLGIFFIYSNDFYFNKNSLSNNTIAFTISIIDLIISLIILLEYDYSNNQFQFIESNYFFNNLNLYLGIDGISIYFVILTNIIIPLAILSNWNSIKDKKKAYLVIMLLLQSLLLSVFVVLDYLLFYIFFESTLPPLFLLIGLFGSKDKVRASFYLFLYTLWGSLFLLLSIITLSSFLSNTDFNFMFKTNIDYVIQLFLFFGIFLAFAVKTPTIFLNNWLLKAHVESPLGGSIILAAIVLKLSLYGIFRLILPILPKIYINYTYFIFTIGVITILYASISTLRTIDIKELIAYSSVSHAAVYLIGSFSNVIQAIEGSILLGIAHGFVSSGLFICVGGVLYDRFGTRLIYYYKGMTQIMPVFSILFFLLCLSNCGVPLSLNFLGEFLCLYGTFERLPLLGLLASTSIVLSAAYTMYMYNRISFGGIYSKYFDTYALDVTKREFFLLFILISFTVILGIYPALILNGLHFVTSLLLYNL